MKFALMTLVILSTSAVAGCSVCGLVSIGAWAAVVSGLHLLSLWSGKVGKMYYVPKPWHLLYSVLLFFLGGWCMTMQKPWIGVGWLVWGIASLAAFWVVLGGLWAERSRYFESVAGAVEAASKVDLDKLAALGLQASEVPESVHVDLYSGSKSEHFSIPISPVKMRSIAYALLDGQSFSERRWSGAGALLSIGEFRSLRQVLRAHGLIEPVSDKANQQGFVLTDAGIEFMRSWLSPALPDDVP